ncbi:carbon storage regulator CsrA [Legionella pneumophila]|jgi:carbon storage regulator|uniref:carbon storage regulator CsrA n=1 Tax=Legionella pneumophila TaxID=446 RepID=UPI0002C0A58D|nr:carbon storage regulator CsrA [Legionella pneumophila]AGH55383.1 csrA [Legionella pneumophila subsp. pneumophila LPE509]MCW8442365.1 carbon storage regulator CsrA [Legionella pneumophila]
MLILTRRIGETVVIGDDVFITILGIKGNQIRLGFDAPDHVSIHRQEIYLKVQEQKKMRLDSGEAVNGNGMLITPLKQTEPHQYTAH